MHDRAFTELTLISVNNPYLADDGDEHEHGCKRLIRLPPSWQVEATFDGPGGCWRYLLTHRWRPGPLALFAMMNPSGAGLRVGDATVMKTSRISMRLGYGGQIIVNVCAYRGVQTSMLLNVTDPVGPKNLDTIKQGGSGRRPDCGRARQSGSVRLDQLHYSRSPLFS
jgi:hypothetical protein